MDRLNTHKTKLPAGFITNLPPGEIHLERQCASEGLLKGVAPTGELHEIAQPAPEALLTGVVLTGEIHLKRQCASEGILEGVNPKGEFHEIAQAASEALLAGGGPQPVKFTFETNVPLRSF